MSYSTQRKSIKFWKLPDEKPKENEIIFSKVFLYQTTDRINCYCNNLQSFGNESFYGNGVNNTPFFNRLAIVKDDDSFKIKYCGMHGNGFYSTKIILQPNEYGRAIFNERGEYVYTGIWYYDLIIYNFVNASYSSFNNKIFFKKKPDHEFTDMQYLRYC